MDKIDAQYQMRVSQITPSVFKLKLVRNNARKAIVVFETVASTIPSTLELICQYKQVSY